MAKAKALSFTKDRVYFCLQGKVACYEEVESDSALPKLIRAEVELPTYNEFVHDTVYEETFRLSPHSDRYEESINEKGLEVEKDESRLVDNGHVLLVNITFSLPKKKENSILYCAGAFIFDLGFYLYNAGRTERKVDAFTGLFLFYLNKPALPLQWVEEEDPYFCPVSITPDCTRIIENNAEAEKLTLKELGTQSEEAIRGNIEAYRYHEKEERARA